MKAFYNTYFLLILLNLSSCDLHSDYSYYILNKCDTVIRIRMIVDLGRPEADWGWYGYADSVVVLNPGMQRLIYIFNTINPVESESGKPEYLFRTLKVSMGSDTSKVNYINETLWKRVKTGKYHMSLFLTILPSDFY